MERRSFVKNIFGSIIGFAVLPTALTEFIQKDESKLTPASKVVYSDLSKFIVGDLLKTDDGELWYVTSKSDFAIHAKNVNNGVWMYMEAPLSNRSIINARLISRQIIESSTINNENQRLY